MAFDASTISCRVIDWTHCCAVRLRPFLLDALRATLLGYAGLPVTSTRTFYETNTRSTIHTNLHPTVPTLHWCLQVTSYPTSTDLTSSIPFSLPPSAAMRPYLSIRDGSPRITSCPSCCNFAAARTPNLIRCTLLGIISLPKIRDHPWPESLTQLFTCKAQDDPSTRSSYIRDATQRAGHPLFSRGNRVPILVHRSLSILPTTSA